jgi:DNA-binding beta-propeller fold protein YncE
MGGKNVRKRILMLAAFTFLGTTTLLAMGRRLEGALNPTLLWEKEFPSSIIIDRNMKLARITGDVMVTVYPETREAEEIAGVYLFDKNGNEISHWKKGFGTISDNGEIILFTSGPTGAPFHNRVHYCTRDGQELWNGRIGEEVYISPDGGIVIDAAGEEDSTQLLEAYDHTGRKIWSYKIGEEGIDVMFSPDSQYIVAAHGDANVRLYRRDGTLLWKKRNYGYIVSVSTSASYISLSSGEVRWTSRSAPKGSSLPIVYDKDGNIIYKDVFAKVSEDGKKLVVSHNESIEILSLPEKVFSKTYPLAKDFLTMSYNGKYLAILGRRTDVASSNNLFVIDTVEDKIWETEIQPKGKSEFNQMQVFLTKDGKYMLIQGKGKLYYYQLY